MDLLLQRRRLGAHQPLARSGRKAFFFGSPEGGARETWAQFVARESGARVTGLRLRGLDPEIRADAYEFDNSQGIAAMDAADLLVDNNELSG